MTGGAYGIGRGIVQEFVGKGEAVVIADLDAERGAALESSIAAAGRSGLVCSTDVRIESQIQALMAQV